MLGGRSNLWESELEVFRIIFPNSAIRWSFLPSQTFWIPLFYNVCCAFKKGKKKKPRDGEGVIEVKDGLRGIPNQMGEKIDRSLRGLLPRSFQ